MLVYKTTRTHFEKFEKIAQNTGIGKLIPFVPATKDELLCCYKSDPNLNNIPLWKWDGHPSEWEKFRTPTNLNRVASFVRNEGGISLGEMVCLLKHVAIVHVIGATFVEAQAEKSKKA